MYYTNYQKEIFWRTKFLQIENPSATPKEIYFLLNPYNIYDCTYQLVLYFFRKERL